MNRPRECPNGGRDCRGRIIKAGPVGMRAALIEAAWVYGTDSTPPSRSQGGAG